MRTGLPGQLSCKSQTSSTQESIAHDAPPQLSRPRHMKTCSPAASASKGTVSGSGCGSVSTSASTTKTSTVSRTIRLRCASRYQSLAQKFAAMLPLLYALLLARVITPAAAVQIPFSNCLSDEYQNSKPPLLQWVPVHADANFVDAPNSNDWTFRMVVWGNVAGSYEDLPLPPAGHPDWTDNTKTNGKIINAVPGSTKATTLYRKINSLSYMPYEDTVSFCASGLVNGSCPLSPNFKVNAKNESVTYHELPSFNMTHNLGSSYSFASFAPTFLVLFGDLNATNIGCVSATITPDLGTNARLIKFLPLAILLFSAVAVILAAVFSPWGSMDVFHWTSNYGRDADLLRLVTPGFGDCLQYIQFIALTGGLKLSYPGFYQPIVSQMSWSALMFNESFVSHAPSWQSVVDGIYVTDAKYGLHQLGQLVGMAKGEDIWAGMMVWLCVIIACAFVIILVGFLVQWLSRRVNKTPEEDLRAKNIPFLVGNAVRIIFNYMLLPLVALSCFQLVIANDSPSFTVGLAAVTLILLIGFASWLLFLVIRTRPRSVLFDDLPTVLLYGPMYNTYSDGQAAYALIPILLTFVRGIAIGAIQPSGVVQVVLLAICEVITILTLLGFRPYSAPTSMNAYHMVFSFLRLATVVLMVAFAPSLGLTEGPKGWIGYAILIIHGCVLLFGFFLSALQTIVEVIARMLGAGGNNEGGQTRGGLTKIFGMRELSRREIHREGPSRASQLSTSAMLDMEDGAKTGYVMPSGRVRSGSAASLSGMAGQHRHRSSSALESIDVYSGRRRNVESTSSYMPGTPGDASTYSFLASPTAVRQNPLPLGMETSDPHYRPPRRRNDTITDSISSDQQHGGALGIDMSQFAPPDGPSGEVTEPEAEISRDATPAPTGAANHLSGALPNGPDYSTREVDFYYGVRGPALNSEGPGRKLGTGPADPTGPVATASGWFRTLLGGKSKEKGKGFEVVRSSRMPPSMMAPNGGFGDETPPEGIPVATDVVRNGPIDSDDEDIPPPKRSPRRPPPDLLTDSNDDDQVSHHEQAASATAGRKGLGLGPDDVSDEESDSEDEDGTPGIPRKSSKRHSALQYIQLHLPSLSLIESDSGSGLEQVAQENQSTKGHPHSLSATSALPFERTGSQKRLSSKSSLDFPGDLTDVDLHGRTDERPASFGVVPHHEINRVDPQPRYAENLESSAEVIDARNTRK